jgi:hypothetical protein
VGLFGGLGGRGQFLSDNRLASLWRTAAAAVPS